MVELLVIGLLAGSVSIPLELGLVVVVGSKGNVEVGEFVIGNCGVLPLSFSRLDGIVGSGVGTTVGSGVTPESGAAVDGANDEKPVSTTYTEPV
jgi:hypothetical protein